MDENFEEELSGMMRYRSTPVAPFTPGDVVTSARRRSRTRGMGVAGSALAVVAIGVGAVSLAGNGTNADKPVGAAAGAPQAAAGAPQAAAVTTSAPVAANTQPANTGAPKQALGVSPVKTVASGEKITVVDGYQVWVTSHEKCASESAAFMGAPDSAGGTSVCKDVTGSNMAWDRTGSWLSIQGTGTMTAQVLSGTYQGKTAPTLIDVEQDGKHYPATILKTAGMEQNHWVAYYVTFPVSNAKPGDLKRTSYTVTAYDADGKPLSQDPPASLTPGTTTSAPTK